MVLRLPAGYPLSMVSHVSSHYESTQALETQRGAHVRKVAEEVYRRDARGKEMVILVVVFVFLLHFWL